MKKDPRHEGQKNVAIDLSTSVNLGSSVVNVQEGIEKGAHLVTAIKLSANALNPLTGNREGVIQKEIAINLSRLLAVSNGIVFLDNGSQQIALKIWGDFPRSKNAKIQWLALENSTHEDVAQRISELVTPVAERWIQQSQEKINSTHDAVNRALYRIKSPHLYIGVASPGHGGYYENLWPKTDRKNIRLLNADSMGEYSSGNDNQTKSDKVHIDADARTKEVATDVTPRKLRFKVKSADISPLEVKAGHIFRFIPEREKVVMPICMLTIAEKRAQVYPDLCFVKIIEVRTDRAEQNPKHVGFTAKAFFANPENDKLVKGAFGEFSGNLPKLLSMCEGGYSKVD